jgi:hypothetical protein
MRPQAAWGGEVPGRAFLSAQVGPQTYPLSMESPHFPGTTTYCGFYTSTRLPSHTGISLLHARAFRLLLSFIHTRTLWISGLCSSYETLQHRLRLSIPLQAALSHCKTLALLHDNPAVHCVYTVQPCRNRRSSFSRNVGHQHRHIPRDRRCHATVLSVFSALLRPPIDDSVAITAARSMQSHAMFISRRNK